MSKYKVHYMYYSAINGCAVYLCERLFIACVAAYYVCRCFWLTLVSRRNTLTVIHTSIYRTVMTRTWQAQPDMPVLMLTLAVNRAVVMTSSHSAMSWCISTEDLCHGRVSRFIAAVNLYTGWAKNCTINFIRRDLNKTLSKNCQIWYLFMHTDVMQWWVQSACIASRLN